MFSGIFKAIHRCFLIVFPTLLFVYGVIQLTKSKLLQLQ